MQNYNGTELRAALAALPETPSSPAISSQTPVENNNVLVNLSQVQGLPLHGDYLRLESTTDDVNFNVELNPVSLTQIPSVTVPSGARIRYVAVNPNGETESELTQCN